MAAVDTNLISAHGIVLHDDPVPLQIDDHGAIRVRGGRITLDLIVEQYENGMTPEELVAAYDSLELPEVYGVIAYYLRHRDEVRGYLARRKIESEKLLRQLELLAQQRAGAEPTHVATGN